MVGRPARVPGALAKSGRVGLTSPLAKSGWGTAVCGQAAMACLAPPGESPEAASGEGTGLPDVTVLLDDSRLGQCAEPPAREEPVLALVSLNPKTATSYNLRRGKIQVLPDIPLAPGAAGTHHIRCGRDPAHPMAIGDARVSLLHFTIRMRTAPDGSVTLDLMDQSSNGTWVNGQRVGQGKSVPLKAAGGGYYFARSDQLLWSLLSNRTGFLEFPTSSLRPRVT